MSVGLAVVLGRPGQVGTGVADLEQAGATRVHVGEHSSPLQRVVHDGSTSGHGRQCTHRRASGRPVCRVGHGGRRAGEGPARARCRGATGAWPRSPEGLMHADVSSRYIDGTARRRRRQCSNSPSSACCTSRRCTATSCASSSPQVLGGLRSISYGSLYPALKRMHGRRADRHRRARPARACCRPTPRRSPAGAGKVVYTITAEGKERFHELVSADRPGGLRRRRAASASAWRSSGTPPPTCGCGSSRAAAAPSSGSGRGCGPRWRAPGSGSTATPSSCSGTAWSRWTARSAGSSELIDTERREASERPAHHGGAEQPTGAPHHRAPTCTASADQHRGPRPRDPQRSREKESPWAQ